MRLARVNERGVHAEKECRARRRSVTVATKAVERVTGEKPYRGKNEKAADTRAGGHRLRPRRKPTRGIAATLRKKAEPKYRDRTKGTAIEKV